MRVEFVDEIDSTHLYLVSALRNKTITSPYCIVADIQNAGVGSRGNEWSGGDGNLFMSFCVDKFLLPDDLNDASISIYFSMIMAEILKKYGSKVWVKWPNDFYINELKIGGTISTKINDAYVGSIGINLYSKPEKAGVLDIKVSRDSLVWAFCEELEKKPKWKQIFSKFKIEFQKSKNYITHVGDDSISLACATLCDDGAIMINNKKVYSLR
ncbi:biotin--[acetyl-CoA-carboxylase] ligase [Campylobacter majalis]|uniref:biotin--[acetyl-CoA-carboxylase] ligase n=1 Tax=Campylobacter majalis TaxID=2790656 RepID=UPI003D691065